MDQNSITNKISSINVQSPKKYDLEERTARFGENIIDFSKTLPHNIMIIPLVNQVIKSGTSIGANYAEADAADSKKEFRHRLSICRREAKETKYWLRILAHAIPENGENAKVLWKEAQELVLIFSSILK